MRNLWRAQFRGAGAGDGLRRLPAASAAGLLPADGQPARGTLVGDALVRLSDKVINWQIGVQAGNPLVFLLTVEFAPLIVLVHGPIKAVRDQSGTVSSFYLWPLVFAHVKVARR